MITEFIVTVGEGRKRLDLFLLNREREISRSGLQRLIASGRVRLNTQVVKPSHKIKPGDRITLDTPKPGPLLIDHKPMPLEILFEDKALLVVNKPPGIVVHPTSGNWTGTLLNAVLDHILSLKGAGTTKEQSIQPGIVHRLDKDTSGVMVIAKSNHVHRALALQFENHSIHRAYEAFVYGVPGEEEGIIDLPIGRDRQQPQIVSTNAAHTKQAVTTYRIIKRLGEVGSHVTLIPRTGRTHQLRVHMSSMGYPILGDQTYGGQKVLTINHVTIPRVMLHASILGFQHPGSGNYQEYSVAIPEDMLEICRGLARQGDSEDRAPSTDSGRTDNSMV